MPDMQSSVPAAASAMASSVSQAASAPAFDDIDYALGCECADPSLQIERWTLEAPGAGSSAS